MTYQTGQDIQNNNSAKHEVLKQTSSASYPFLIEVTYNNTVYRFVKYFENVTFDGNEYVASDFTFTPPEETTEGIKDATLTISDVEQFWTEKMRNANTFDEITVKFVAVIIFESDLTMTVCEIENILFNVKSIAWNGITMDIQLSFDERTSINIPCDIMDSIKCAGAY